MLRVYCFSVSISFLSVIVAGNNGFTLNLMHNVCLQTRCRKHDVVAPRLSLLFLGPTYLKEGQYETSWSEIIGELLKIFG